MDEVIIKKHNSTIVLTLNRERVLNALNLNMVRILYKNILLWKNDDSVSGVLIKGAGEKSFCAGGDIVSVYHEKNNKNNSLSHDFFKEEYLLNYEISNFEKPWVSMLNGIAMGGGLGLSVHGSHRIISEKTMAAMPETAIGLFPDVGGGYFLSRMKDSLGVYLALTGNIIDADNAMYSGIGTHFIENKLVKSFIDEFLKLENYTIDKVNSLLTNYKNKKNINPTFKGENHFIKKHFSLENIQEIFESLEKDKSDWAIKHLNVLRKKSPTSMAVALKQLKLAKVMNLKDCLSMEFRICQTMMRKNDFYEGVRANLVDKDRKPNWKPKSVFDLTSNIVDEHFVELKEKELFN